MTELKPWRSTLHGVKLGPKQRACEIINRGCFKPLSFVLIFYDSNKNLICSVFQILLLLLAYFGHHLCITSEPVGLICLLFHPLT